MCFHNPSNSDMYYGIFNVPTDVNACDCTRGCPDTVRESALKVDSGRKIPCRTEECNLRQRRAGPTLYQLSYIPTPVICRNRRTGNESDCYRAQEFTNRSKILQAQSATKGSYQGESHRTTRKKSLSRFWTQHGPQQRQPSQTS